MPSLILSVNYSSILFGKIADIKVIHNEQQFNSIDDILQSNMDMHTPYSPEEYDDPKVRELLSRSKRIENSHDCIDKQIKTRNVICLLVYSRAVYFVEENVNVYGKPLIKIAGPSNGFEIYRYEKASPFAGKIEKIMQYTVESGIPVVWKNRMKRSRSNNNQNEAPTVTEDLLTQVPLIILFIGYLLPTKAFLYELITNSVFFKTKLRFLIR